MCWRAQHAAKSEKEPGKIEKKNKKKRKKKKKKNKKTKHGHHRVANQCKTRANEAHTVRYNTRNNVKRKDAHRGARRKCGQRSQVGRIACQKKMAFFGLTWPYERNSHRDWLRTKFAPRLALNEIRSEIG
jgi:hypothetical protein